MDDEQRQERERIQRIVMEAQMIQTKRTMKALAILTVVYFAIQGALVVYHYFF